MTTSLWLLVVMAILLAIGAWFFPAPELRIYERIQVGDLVRCDPPDGLPPVLRGRDWFCRPGEGGSNVK